MIFSNNSSFPKSSKVVWHSWSRERLALTQNCASGLPNPARLALHLFVCGRGGLNEFPAKLLGTLRKSSKLENGELSIDDSAPERFCEEFRSGVNLSCAPNINPCAESSSPPKWGNLVGMTLGVGSLKCTLYTCL